MLEDWKRMFRFKYIKKGCIMNYFFLINNIRRIVFVIVVVKMVIIVLVMVVVFVKSKYIFLDM